MINDFHTVKTRSARERRQRTARKELKTNGIGMKYKKILSFFCVLLLIVNTSGLQAQEKKLTLTEAIELSIQNSKTLRINQARIAESVAALREARDRRLPDVKISGAYLRVNDPSINLKTKEDNGSSGGNSGGSMPKVSQAAYGMANLSLPLFTGGRLKYGIEAAEYLENAVRLDAENDQEAVVLNTINAFTNFYKAIATVTLVKESLEQSKQRVTHFTNLEKNGLLARNDLLKAQLHTSNIELSLLDAENNLELANVSMDLMLGFPEKTVLVPDSLPFGGPEPVESLETYEQLSRLHRKDMEALSLRKKAAASGVNEAKAELFPGLALTGGYVALDVPKLLTVTNAVNLGLGVQYSLSSLWKTRAKIDQAKAREWQLAISEEQLSDAVYLAVNEAYRNYLLSRRKIEVYHQAIEQAKENYRVTKNKYDNSLVNTTELLDADLAQLQANLNYTFSRADSFVAYEKLLETAGLLTDQVAKK